MNDDPEVRRVAAETFRPLFGLMLAYCVGLQIGLTLTTVITLRNLPDPGGFSRIRLYGTVGWIVAGYAIGQFLAAVSSQPLYLAAGASGLLGAVRLPAAAHPAEGDRPDARRDVRAAGPDAVPGPVVRGVRRGAFACTRDEPVLRHLRATGT